MISVGVQQAKKGSSIGSMGSGVNVDVGVAVSINGNYSSPGGDNINTSNGGVPIIGFVDLVATQLQQKANEKMIVDENVNVNVNMNDNYNMEKGYGRISSVQLKQGSQGDDQTAHVVPVNVVANSKSVVILDSTVEAIGDNINDDNQDNISGDDCGKTQVLISDLKKLMCL